ncbi:alpha/beta hydrolase [Sphingomonas crusticola]|uniref:alpha/beta hydrolase n=1 Tax=Sphingomonas crusticola TaxID=1697973 RepID=UPI001F0744FD|nr:alpha/beta hydrolase [Sphingomonas crusticola]
MLILAAASASVGVAAGPVPGDPTEILPLWPALPPGAPATLPPERFIERATAGQPHDRYAEQIARPTITVFRPQRPNGNAVLLVPGGGYHLVVTDKEGYETARWLNARGITAFVLRYRLPGGGWAHRADVPLQDAQRAIRLVRAHAAGFQINPERVAVMGFSAGGHVAASLAVRHAASVYEPVDAADRLSARPDVAALLYPVISMGEHAHPGSRDELLGKAPAAADVAAYSPDRTVGAGTPPTILVHAVDDDVVPVENSLAMFGALRAAHIPAELHVFEKGGHGFGLRLPQTNSAARWPDLFLAFAQTHGFIG